MNWFGWKEQKTHPPVSPFFKGDFKSATDRHLRMAMGHRLFLPLLKRGTEGDLIK